MTKTGSVIVSRRLRFCVLGGTGFVGRHLVNRLIRDRHTVKILTRSFERNKGKVPPDCELVQIQSLDSHNLARHFEDIDVVINLIGILHERHSGDFQRAHVDIPRHALIACKESGVKRLLHMSALGASANGPSAYLRTKGLGEDAVHADATNSVGVTSLRPSVIFGPDDAFLNRFATLMRLAPGFVPVVAPHALLAPVAIDNVVDAFVACAQNSATSGQRLDLCGPKTYSLRQLMQLTAASIGIKRCFINLPPALATLQAMIMERLPGKILTRDNLLSLMVDNVSERNALPSLGIHPTSLEAVIGRMLNPTQAYDTYRANTVRSTI